MGDAAGRDLLHGSILASAAVLGAGLFVLLRRVFRRRRGITAIKAALTALLAVALAVLMGTAPAAAVGPSAVNMGPVINTSHRDAEPSFTSDGRTMYFNCNDIEICVTTLNGAWEGERWTSPRLIGNPINSSYFQVEPVINPAGDKLYITSDRPFGSGEGVPGLALYIGALYQANDALFDRFGISLLGGLGHDKVLVSNLVNGAWTEPKKLNDVAGEPPIDSGFNDHCIVVSADGNKVFWTSDRPGGYGGNDIWTMRRIDGKWTKPKNLGPSVNGPYSEHHSMLSPDGKSLYITSDRPGGYGGEDIYVTTRGADENWGPLRDLPPPVNGPGNDRCPVLTQDNRIFIFDSDRAGGYGSKDLWWVYRQQVSG